MIRNSTKTNDTLSELLQIDLLKDCNPSDVDFKKDTSDIEKDLEKLCNVTGHKSIKCIGVYF